MQKAPGLPRSGLYGPAALLGASTFLSRLLGLLREQVFAYFFGAGTATDAFQIAFRIPNLLRDLFAEGAMSSALVPVYTRLRFERGEAEAWQLVRNVATSLALLLGLVTLVGMVFAGPLVSLFAPAFREIPGKHELTVHLVRLLWPFLPLVVMAAVWMGILNARESFAIPALAPTLFNVVSLVSAFTLCPLAAHVFGYPPIYGWALGATLGGLAQWLVQVPWLRREGFRYAWVFQPANPELRRMVGLMGAGTFALAATQVNVLVNSALASMQGEGAVSWLYYAFRLMQFPIGIFGVAIATANLTKVSRETAQGDLASVRATLRDSLRLMTVLTVPSSLGLAVAGIPIISVIYQHGRFLAADTYQTSLALAGYSVGLFAYAAVRLMVPVLYSLGLSRLAVWSSGLGMALNVGFSFLFVRRLGFFGLALAMSTAAILEAVILLWLLERYLKQIEFKNLAFCLGKTILSSIVMAIIVYIFLGFIGAAPFRPIPLTGVWDKANFAAHLLYLLTALGLGLATFGLGGKLLGLQEVERIQGYIWKRLKICMNQA